MGLLPKKVNPFQICIMGLTYDQFKPRKGTSVTPSNRQKFQFNTNLNGTHCWIESQNTVCDCTRATTFVDSSSHLCGLSFPHVWGLPDFGHFDLPLMDTNIFLILHIKRFCFGQQEPLRFFRFILWSQTRRSSLSLLIYPC